MLTLDIKKFDTIQDYQPYTPSTDESTKIGYVEQRFAAMQSARTVVDQNWDTWQRMVEARYEAYEDERSSSVIPVMWAIIELFAAEASKIPSEPVFKAETSEYSTQAKALEYVWKYDRRVNNRENALDRNEYVTAAFGTSIMYTGYECYDKTQMDFEVDDNMNYSRTPRTYREEKILLENADIRLFYLDNQAIDDIEQAVDCIYRQWISFEKFQNFKNNPVYKNIDKVQSKGYSTEFQTFFTKEDTVREGQFVELRNYWNVEKDVYMVVANGVLVREHPMVSTIDGKKALPFVVRRLGKKIYSIYGKGLCEAAMTFVSDLNNLREMLMDGIKRSNMPTIAIGGGLTFNGRNFSFDNQILTFNGKLNQDNFQQIAGIPPNQAIFEQIDRIYKEMAMIVGLDVQNILSEPQQTAFQTEVQREASQKRVNVWLKNRGLAYERLYNLHKDNLQTHFPRKTADGLYPQIEIEGEKLTKGKKPKFIKTTGKKTKNIFEVTPEVLRGQVYIDVTTDVTTNTINAVDKDNKLRFATAIGPILQAYILAKNGGVDMDSIYPIKDMLQELANDCNMDVPSDTGSSEETEKAVTDLGDELLQASNSQPPAPPSDQQAQPSQPQPVPPPSAPNPAPAGAPTL